MKHLVIIIWQFIWFVPAFLILLAAMLCIAIGFGPRIAAQLYWDVCRD